MLNVKQIFEIGLKMGIAADPRGKNGVKKYLAQVKSDYEDMSSFDQDGFDKDRLVNPYVDSAILFDNEKPVRRVMAGIDVTEPEVLLSAHLASQGKPVDLLIAHHPIGKARANLHEVMDMAVDVYTSYGVAVHVAEKMMEDRVREVGRWVHSLNHYKAVDVASLLNVNFIATHTITDNLVDEFLRNYVAERKPERIKDLLDILYELPEYQQARKMGFGPKIFSGNPKHRVGKILLEMTGGTTPSHRLYDELSKSGISTLLSMHMPDNALEKINVNLMNVVIAGHMSSDSLGMNLYLDELEKQGIEVVPCGGLIRVSRVNKAAVKSKKK